MGTRTNMGCQETAITAIRGDLAVTTANCATDKTNDSDLRELDLTIKPPGTASSGASTRLIIVFAEVICILEIDASDSAYWWECETHDLWRLRCQVAQLQSDGSPQRSPEEDMQLTSQRLISSPLPPCFFSARSFLEDSLFRMGLSKEQMLHLSSNPDSDNIIATPGNKGSNSTSTLLVSADAPCSCLGELPS